MCTIASIAFVKFMVLITDFLFHSFYDYEFKLFYYAIQNN